MAFGSAPFYFYSMRKIINAMGVLLNGIDVVKRDLVTGDVVPGKITVPVEYAGKEGWFSRLTQDPSANVAVQVQLPVITYELKGLHYDAARKLSSYQRQNVVLNDTQATKYACAFPYNMEFEVSIWTRNIDDSFQIMEQILPFFDPNYVVAMKYLTANNGQGGNNYVVDEVPFVLESVQPDFQYSQQAVAGGSRTIVWTLEFTAKALFFGPMSQVGVVKEVIVNFRNLNEIGNANNLYAQTTITAVSNLTVNVIQMYTNGSGFYANNEPVKGQTSGTVANIVSWNTGNDVLVVANTTGAFQTNEHIVGVFTGADFVSNTINTSTLNVQHNVAKTTEYN